MRERAATKQPDLKGLDAMEGVAGVVKKCRRRFVHYFSISVVVCMLLYARRVFVLVPGGVDLVARERLHAGGNAGDAGLVVLDNQVGSPCAAMANNTICCDRSDPKAEVCFMAGDVRTDYAASQSLLLFPPASGVAAEEERVRPYPNMWGRWLVKRIHEVRLRVSRPEEAAARRRCDVRHDAPALVMSAGGYSYNFFHAFTDGLLPAWVTAQHLRRRVVLAVLAYNPTWAGTFGDVIGGLSDYHVVDLLNDKRMHCFPGAIVGPRSHGILTVDPARLRDNKTIVDFHHFLAGVFGTAEKPPETRRRRRPRLGIVSRKGTRVIENQAAVARLAAAVGFEVDVLETANGMPLPAVYAAVSACDALVGVHGADMTRLLFLRPGRAALAQVVPLGVAAIARGCFGAPAARMGLRYEAYEVGVPESSLSRRYAADDAVVADPERAKREKGWNIADVVRVYLTGQNVSLDLGRFRETLVRLHSHAMLQRRREERSGATVIA
ncbi:hypothetical protein ACP4OV_019940 [Aristida adscensionis]